MADIENRDADKQQRVRSAAEALRAAGLANSTANQRRAKRALESLIMQGRNPTVDNFREEFKNTVDEGE